VQFIEQNIASNENSLSRNPKHRVFIGVALDVFKDLYFLSSQFNKVAVEFFSIAQLERLHLARIVFHLSISLDRPCDSVYYRRIRNNRTLGYASLKLQTRMIGVLMGNVNMDSGFLVSLIPVNTLSAWFLLMRIDQHHFMCSFDNDGV